MRNASAEKRKIHNCPDYPEQNAKNECVLSQLLINYGRFTKIHDSYNRTNYGQYKS